MNEFTFSVPQNIIVGSGTMAKLPEIAKNWVAVMRSLSRVRIWNG